MGALFQVHRPAIMPGDVPSDDSLSDRVDHIAVVNLGRLLQPSLRLPVYRLVARDRRVASEVAR